LRIFLAKHSGFCEGVQRAYRIALGPAKSKKKIFILGDLVHNKDVVREFTAHGVVKIQNLKGLKKGSTVIVTAHGTTPELISELKSKGLNLIDTTCPWVTKAQRIAKRLHDEGRQVIIVGDKGHPEVKGIYAWAARKAVIVQDISDLKRVKLKERVGVVAQTTQTKENFLKVVSEIKNRSVDVAVHNTICGATSRRQDSARDLSRKVDVMLVIGDFRSANTKRLAELCDLSGVVTHHIQNAGELKLSWLKKALVVGITAGASTPDRVIDKVMEKIKKNEK
jgi:small subunit ribosomal protein S1